LARISSAEAHVFAHEALEGSLLSLKWTNRAAAVLNASISGIAQTFTASDPDKITGLASLMIQAGRKNAHRMFGQNAEPSEKIRKIIRPQNVDNNYYVK
jgi:hypothetical protein